jgi:hypothetical protein
MRCEACNTENVEDAEYCAGCGERLVYDEAFFKRENNVDALPKISAEMRKPIHAFKKGSAWALIAQRMFEPEDEEEASRWLSKRRKGRSAGVIFAFCLAMVLLAAVFTTRVLH